MRGKSRENIRWEYNHLLQAIPESGAQFTTLHFPAFSDEDDAPGVTTVEGILLVTFLKGSVLPLFFRLLVLFG